MKRACLPILALCLFFAASACARRDESQQLTRNTLRHLQATGSAPDRSATSIASGGQSASASATAGPGGASTQQSATGAGSTVLGVSQVGEKIDACQRGPANSAECATLTTADRSTLCSDIPPDTQYTCPQQVGFNKCDEPFIFKDAYCLRSCNRCGDGCVDVLPPGYGCDAADCDADYVTAGPFCLRTCKRCSAAP